MLRSLGMPNLPGLREQAVNIPYDQTPRQELGPPAAALPAGVVFRCPAYGPLSQASEARTQALALARTGVPVCLVPTDSPDDPGSWLGPAAWQQLDPLTHTKLDLARSVLYQASAPTDWNLDYHGRCRVGRAAFWTDRIPRSWVEPCNAMDEVWVPSELQRQAFADSGVPAQKLRVLRSGVDTDFFRPGRHPLAIPQRRSFNFLAVGNLADRQGTDLLLTAFAQEFGSGDDVSLTLKIVPSTERPIDPAAELAFFLERSAGVALENSAPLILLEQWISASDMASLYAAADALVLPSRGVASGRMLLEALASELPVIATAWGGPLEFLDESISYLTDLEGLVPVPCGQDFLTGHRWASPSPAHLRQCLREVFAHPEEARGRARLGRRRVVENWDCRALLPRWENEFRRLLG